MDIFWGALGVGIAGFLIIVGMGIASFFANNLEVKIQK